MAPQITPNGVFGTYCIEQTSWFAEAGFEPLRENLGDMDCTWTSVDATQALSSDSARRSKTPT